MKTKIAFLLAVVLALSVSAAFAQEEFDNNTHELIIANDTQNEIETIAYPHGAEIRLLQLEKAITINIAHGTKVIEVLNKTSNETTISDLQSIVDELKILNQEVKNFSFEGNVSEITKRFVDLKSDAIELSMKFRTIAVHELNSTQKIQLREEFGKQEQESGELKNLTSEIRNQTREFNAQRLKNFLNITGLKNETFVGQVRNGEVNGIAIMARLKANLMQLDKMQKKQALLQLREEVLKNKVRRDAAVIATKGNFTERKITRLQSRIQNLTGANVTQMMQNLQSRINSTSALRDIIGRGKK